MTDVRRHADRARPETTSGPPIADPGPLGFAALALPTFVLSMFTSGLMSVGGEPVVLSLAFAYGGVAQLLAGMWEFKNGNTFGATAFTSLGAYWLSFWMFVAFYVKTIPAAETGHAYGLFGIAWGFFALSIFVASLGTTAATATVFFLLCAMFLLLGIGNASGTEVVRTVGGYVGLLAAVAAWYASLAGVVNATFKRVVLPVMPLGG